MHKPLLKSALLIAGVLLAPLVLQAEGSKQLTPNTNPNVALTNATNTRAGFLTHDAIGGEDVSLGFLKPNSWTGTGGTVPFDENYRMYVRIKPGETLYYGVHRSAYTTTTSYNDLILTVRYGSGDGTIVKQNTLARNQSSTSQYELQPNQAGVITSAAQATAGPNVLSSSGYVPLSYTNTTGQTRDFFIEFTQVDEYTNSGTQAGFNDLKTRNTNFAGEARSEYDFWDFTVIGTDNLEKTGRLFSRFWAFTAGTSSGSTTDYQNRLSATFKLYPLVPSAQNPGQYYVKEVELAGMRPLVFYYVTNEFGSTASAVGGATDFATRRKSQVGNTAYAQYPNFVNDPDPSLWPSAPAPNVSVTPRSYCRNGVTEVAFTTTAAETGQFDILIDLNGTSGYQAGTADRLLSQTVQGGTTNTVIWNGLDGNNTRVNATGQVITFNFTSNGAAFNFPVYDAEGNPDGFRVRNIRPANANNYDRLYWDDSNLPTTAFPAPQTSLTGQLSTNGVHSWGTTNDDGNNYTVNTWTYGFSAFAGSTSFVYTSACDRDNDGVADNVDIDDDNDGILDVTEAFTATAGTNTAAVDPSSFRNGTTPILYLDVNYVHPVFGAFVDINNDGTNDYFDQDLDGIPNHLDLDADGDGLTDAFEANGNANPTATFSATRSTGTNTKQDDSYTITSSFDASLGRYTGSFTINYGSVSLPSNVGIGVGANGLPDAVESTTVTYGITAGNGSNPSTLTLAESTTPASRYTLTDNDNDALTRNSSTAKNYNFLDLDSDNDGITDEIEALTSATYNTRSSQTNFKADTDNDGIRDAYDGNVTGGNAISSVVDTDNDGLPDLIDADSDGDNITATATIYQQLADWTEGFDINGTGRAGDDLIAKARAFAAANPTKAAYYPATGPITAMGFLKDSGSKVDGNGTALTQNVSLPNFLVATSSFYHDDNFNGLVDLFDPAYNGVASTAPGFVAANGVIPATQPYFRNNTVAVPLPVTLTTFTAQAAGQDATISWTTAQEVNSAYFVVERSYNGSTFAAVKEVEGKGNKTTTTDYTVTDAKAASGAANGLVYYRLRQVDVDGTVAFSSVQTVNFSVAKAAVAVHPNPATTAQDARLDLTGLAGSYQVTITDLTGRVVRSTAQQGGTDESLRTAALPKGVYIVQIQGNGQSFVQRLVQE